MYSLIFCLAAQIVCLVSLIQSRHEDLYLFWYIPNWLSAVLVSIPARPTGKTRKPYFLAYTLFLFVAVANIAITLSPLYTKPWVGIAPAFATIFSSLVVKYV